MDQATLEVLQTGLRHIKGLVGVFEGWIALQKEKGTTPSKDTAKGQDFKF